MVGCGDNVLVDLTFLLEASERSFHGVPIFLGPEGQDNTVLYGVTRDLLRLRAHLGIRNGIIIIGSDANKVSLEANIGNAADFFRRLGVGVVHEPRATAGSLCKRLASVARSVVTQNRTFFQLVRDDFSVIVPDPAGSGPEIITVESLKASLGIRPDQVPSFLAMTEDGKRAFFTKRQASRLLEIHGDLEKLLQDVSVVLSSQVRRQLSKNKAVLLDRLRCMRLEEATCQLAALTDSALPFIRDDENSARVLREYGFLSLVRLLPTPPPATSVTAAQEEKGRVAYKAVRSEAAMREVEALISKSDVCAVDTEASDKDPRKASLLGVAFSVRAGEAFYVPVMEADLEATSPEAIITRLRELFASRSNFVGHNIRFDYVLLRRYGITIKHVLFDTMLAAYECFGDWEFLNLSAVAKKLLGRDIRRYRDIVGEGESLLDLPFRDLLDHACSDADTTLQLYHRLREEIERRSLSEQFSKGPMALLRVLAEKECSGVRLNIRAVHRRREALAQEAAALRRTIVAEAGREFDLDSPSNTAAMLRQIGPVGEQIGRRRLTLTQLEELAGAHSLVRLIVKYGRVQKLLRQLEEICEAAKGDRVFPIFSQIKWAHESLSSTDPRICEPDGALEARAVIDKTVREWMRDRNRSLDILQRVTGDKALKDDLQCGAKNNGLLGTDGPGRGLDQRDLLLSLVVGLPDAALCRRFLIDRPTLLASRQAFEARYVKVFNWVNTYRRDVVARGFAYHDGKRKYLEGLRSSDINKRHKAIRSAVRWLIRY
jgi:DNA polymerase-1